MRNVCCHILGPILDTASSNGIQINAGQLMSGSFHVVFTDATAAGTVNIQGSNDPCVNDPNAFTVTNWVNIPNASSTFTVGGQAMITIGEMPYRWLRATWTRTSGGSGTVTVNMNAISV